MNLNFSQVIAAIEAEIEPSYMPGAIRWCDENMGGAWSNAIDRFEKALLMAIERNDYVLAQSEGEFYKLTILKLLKQYKEHKHLDETSSFLNSLNSSKGERNGS